MGSQLARLLLVGLVMVGCTRAPTQTQTQAPPGQDAKQPAPLDEYACKEPMMYCNRAEELGLANRTRYGRGIAIADVDGDGWEDVWLTDSEEREHETGAVSELYRKIPSGGFVPVDAGVSRDDLHVAWSSTLADYDNDGDPDLFLANGGLNGTSNIALYRNDSKKGAPKFTSVSKEVGLTPELSHWWGGSWADYDLDGWLDVVVTRAVGRTILLRNVKGTRFEEVSAAVGINFEVPRGGKPPVWLDYDRDGDLDLYLAGNPAHRFYRNDREKGFADITDALSVPLGPYLAGPKRVPRLFSAGAADFNQDGYPDLYLGRWDRQDVVMLNQRDGTFIALGREAGLDMKVRPDRTENTMGLGIGDINEDGLPDVLIGTGDPKTSAEELVYCNVTAPGTPNTVQFARCSEFARAGHGKTQGHGVALADTDQDGTVEIFFNLGGKAVHDREYGGDSRRKPALYTHQRAPDHKTASIRLVGSESNRDAIGAFIKVHTEPPRFYDRRSAQGYQSQNGAWLVLALGTAEEADITIRWPNGKQTNEKVRAGERRDISEASDGPTALRESGKASNAGNAR